MEVDWTKAQGFPLLPDGTYLVEVKDTEMVKNNKGNDQIVVTYEVVQGSEKGNLLKDYIILTEAAMWRFVEFVKACLDFEVAKLPNMDTKDSMFANLIKACEGRTMWVTIFTDEYDGKKRNKAVSQTPYAPDKKTKAKPFEPESLDDVPDWVKA